MRVGQRRWGGEAGWGEPTGDWCEEANLLFVFGAREVLEDGTTLRRLQALAPKAQLVGCSTAGDILGTEVSDGTAVATAVRLERSAVYTASVDLQNHACSREAGVALGASLLRPDLRHVFVLSDGLNVNGSALVRGLAEALPPRVAVTGGLSADAARFERTVVADSSSALAKRIVAVALCGDRLRIGYGSMGGWDAFGPERLVSRAQGNVLYELDDRPALDLYKSYLGDSAADLPASGLLFPLSLRLDGNPQGVVRTILSVDRESGSMTFAGDVPQGSYARLMKANFDRLIDGATGAAARCTEALRASESDLAILISCVGRKLVLKQRTEEEVEGVREILGERPALTGFYSYGEISPFASSARCELHNQTMTITTLGEA